jgi:hypothetical protein
MALSDVEYLPVRMAKKADVIVPLWSRVCCEGACQIGYHPRPFLRWIPCPKCTPVAWRRRTVCMDKSRALHVDKKDNDAMLHFR